MIKLTDGKRTVKITINEWAGNGYTPDWSADFFSVGMLPYNAETESYTVHDIDYCLDYAMDWLNGAGDFYEYGPAVNGNFDYEFI